MYQTIAKALGVGVGVLWVDWVGLGLQWNPTTMGWRWVGNGVGVRTAFFAESEFAHVLKHQRALGAMGGGGGGKAVSRK